MPGNKHHAISIALIALAGALIAAEVPIAFSFLEKLSNIGHWLVAILTLLSVSSFIFSIYYGGKGIQKNKVNPGAGNPFDQQAKYGLFGMALFVINVLTIFIDLS